MPDIHDDDGNSVSRPLTDFWKITSTSVTWLHMLHTMSQKHEGKGVVATVDPATGQMGTSFYLDKSVYSAEDLAGMLGQPVPAGKTELTLKDLKEWAYPVPPTVDYFGEA